MAHETTEFETDPIRRRGLWRHEAGGAQYQADGSDDPDGRQKNRRVEITIKK